MIRWIWLAIATTLLGLAPALAQQITNPTQVGDACAYNSTLPTVATGNYGLLQCDSSGRMIVSPTTSVSVAHTQTTALADNLVAKSSAGSLFSFEVTADSTLSAAAWWLMIYDAAAAPSDGAVTPAKCYEFPVGTASWSYGFASPVAFTTGITLSVSTTGCFTKTASAHAFIAADYQ
jgi:hypothetical protein